jgi:hypothetical protein
MIVFGLLFIMSFILKPLLHVYIANKNNNPIVFSGVAASIEIFWFYTKPVDDKYKSLKRTCNYLHVYNLVFFTVALIAGILNAVHKP